jgi:hypothetical protein
MQTIKLIVNAPTAQIMNNGIYVCRKYNFILCQFKSNITNADKVCIGNTQNQDLNYPWLSSLDPPPLGALVSRFNKNALCGITDSFVYTSRGMMGSDVSRWQLLEGNLYKMAPTLCTGIDDRRR